jgi:hypothetical protein
VQYALFIIFTSVVFFFVDKTGRRPLFIYGAIGLGICQFVVGGIWAGTAYIVPGGIGSPPNKNLIILVTGAPAVTENVETILV